MAFSGLKDHRQGDGGTDRLKYSLDAFFAIREKHAVLFDIDKHYTGGGRKPMDPEHL